MNLAAPEEKRLALEIESRRMVQSGCLILEWLREIPSLTSLAATYDGSAGSGPQRLPAPVAPRTRIVLTPFGDLEREIVLRDDGSAASETTFTYGRIESETKFLDDGVTAYLRVDYDALQNKKETSLSFDGMPFRETNYRYDQASGAYIPQSESSFSADGKSVEYTTRYRFDGSKELELLYSSDGKSLFAETRFRSDGLTVESIKTYGEDSATLLKYTTDGQLSESFDFDNQLCPQSSIRYRSDGTMFRMIFYRAGAGTNPATAKVSEYEYAADGKTLCSELIYAEDGSTRSAKRDYRTDGQTLLRETQYDLGRACLVRDYCVEGKITKERELAPDGSLKRDLTYDGDGTHIEKEILYLRDGALSTKTEVFYRSGIRHSENRYDALDRLELSRTFEESGLRSKETIYWGTGTPRLSSEYRDGVKIADYEFYVGTNQVQMETRYAGYTKIVSEFRADGSMLQRKQYDWQHRLREEESFDSREKPLHSVTYYDKGNKRTETHYGHDGSIQHNYADDGKRVNDLFFDRRGYVTAEMTYLYEGDVLITSKDSTGKEYVYATDPEGKTHRFDNVTPAKLPMDLFTGIPAWRQEHLWQCADELVQKKQRDGRVDFGGLGAILSELARVRDLTEQEKANIWSVIVGRARNESDPKHFEVSVEGALTGGDTADTASFNIWHALLPFNDGFHAPLANMEEELARNHILVQERTGYGRVSGDASRSLPRVDVNSSINQVAALRAFLTGGMTAYAVQWNTRFRESK